MWSRTRNQRRISHNVGTTKVGESTEFYGIQSTTEDLNNRDKSGERT